MNPDTSSARPRGRFLRVVLVTACFCIALAAIVALLLAGLDGMIGRKAWDAYVQQAKAKGQKLTLEEFIPPPIPDEENFAAVPLITKLFAGTGVHKSGLGLPGKPPKLQDQEGRFDLDEWRQYFVAEKMLPDDPETADPAAMLQALDVRFGEQWQQFRDAAARPKSRFLVQWEEGLAAELPHIGVIQDAAKLSALRVRLQLARKDAAAAYGEWLLGWRLAGSMRDELSLISFLVRTTIVELALDGLRAGIATGIWDDATMRSIQAQLNRAEILENYSFAVDSERGIINAFFDQLTADKSGEVWDRIGRRPQLMLPMKMFLHRNRLFLNQYADETLARLDLKAGRIRRVPRRHDPDEVTQGHLRSHIFSLAGFMVGGSETVENRALRTHTQVQAASLACAIERFRLAQGDDAAYPHSLDQLVPKFLPRVPNDVIDGLPMRYRLTDDGAYLIYSVGLNGIDNGGETKAKVRPENQPDWVWRLQPGGD